MTGIIQLPLHDIQEKDAVFIVSDCIDSYFEALSTLLVLS